VNSELVLLYPKHNRLVLYRPHVTGPCQFAVIQTASKFRYRLPARCHAPEFCFPLIIPTNAISIIMTFHPRHRARVRGTPYLKCRRYRRVPCAVPGQHGTCYPLSSGRRVRFCNAVIFHVSRGRREAEKVRLLAMSLSAKMYFQRQVGGCYFLAYEHGALCRSPRTDGARIQQVLKTPMVWAAV
jgi:hypothetical protein